jgi:hypothetical protein
LWGNGSEWCSLYAGEFRYKLSCGDGGFYCTGTIHGASQIYSEAGFDYAIYAQNGGVSSATGYSIGWNKIIDSSGSFYGHDVNAIGKV